MPTDARTRSNIHYPVAETSYGPIRGTDNGHIAQWKGIRYGAPPVGELRWQAPRPPQPSNTITDALAYGPVSPQPRSPIPLGLGNVASEDCLFLNICAPSGITSTNPRPVMVWVHGGAYIFGSGSQPLYDGTTLAGTGDIVVVTINYRLGVLGFADFSSYGPRFHTNIALRDVIAALRWVRANIAAFGGDPQRITVFGESAGAGIITSLLASPAAAGLFDRAIAQSSPVTSVYDRDHARAVAALLLERLAMTAAEAHRAPIQALIAASAYVFDQVPLRNPGRLAFAPIVDDDVLPDYPVARARAGATVPVPLLIGTNKDEAALFKVMRSPLMPVAPHAFRAMLEEIADDQPGLQLPTADHIDSAYSGMSTRARNLGVACDVGFRMPTLWFVEGHQQVAPVYLYRFDWATAILKFIGLGAAHAAELVYVWGNLLTNPRDLTFILGGRKAGAAVSYRMRTRWAHFAATGSPIGPADQPQWAPYDTQHRTTLLIDRHDRIVHDVDQSIRLAWGNEVISHR